MENTKIISGNIIDVLNLEIYPGKIKISNGKIKDIRETSGTYKNYIIPGFVDSHVHIESSMLLPLEFARLAVTHGTIVALSDPHEIANVLGVRGVRYMIENASLTPFKFYFGAPSCVPASPFESSGATLNSVEVDGLLKLDEIKFLGEVMDFPGVLEGNPEIIAKINAARRNSKPIDGHAPGLRGRLLREYAAAGISTDHEVVDKDEALEKIKLGVKIQIREGSASRNLDELISLVDKYYKSCMFCTDDIHPDDLIKGHVNEMVKKAIEYGIDPLKVLYSASVCPIKHYNLDVGLLQINDCADFVVVDEEFNVLETYINGEIVSKKGKTLIPWRFCQTINNFKAEKVETTNLRLEYAGDKINVIEAQNGQLLTRRLITTPTVKNGLVISDIERDILKIAVLNRYGKKSMGIGFIKNFGLKEGAIATSISHDSHNIIAVGVTDEDISRAINLVIRSKGGLCVVSKEKELVLSLPVGGLMSNRDHRATAQIYRELKRLAHSLGSSLSSPFITLSFMSLTVIPEIKITDRGLFDVEKFNIIELFTD